MRVVFLNPVGQLGGAGRSLLDLLSILPKSIPGIDCHVIVGLDGPLVNECSSLGATVHLLPMPDSLSVIGDSGLAFRGAEVSPLSRLLKRFSAALATWKYSRKLNALLKAIAPDIIHSNGIKFHLLSAFSAPRSIPVVWHIRDFIGSRRITKHGLRLCRKRAAGAIAISKSVADDARTVLGPLPLWTVYNAIDTSHFSSSSQLESTYLDDLAGVPHAPSGTLRVGMVGTYARWKGQDLFLQAASHVLSSLPNLAVRFYIIGGPIYSTPGSQFTLNELVELARSLNLGDRMAFVPLQKDIAPVYESLDVLVQSSIRPEPFGRTIVEAMSCSRPVVISRAGGAAELFTEGLDALSFTPGEPDELAQRLRELLLDSTLRERIGRAARHSAVNKFSLTRLGEEIKLIYLSILKAPR